VSEAPIVRLAARGDGVTADGRHVPLTAPGDRLAADGMVLPGPHHADPPCRHFPRCGGCQLQHVDDAAYADYLIERVAGAMAAQGLSAPEIHSPHLSPPRTRRRASLRAERMGKQVVLGFNEGASHRIVDMRECHILLPELFALIDPLRRMLPAILPPRRTANIYLAWSDQGADVAIDGVTVEGLAAHEALTAFAQTHALARLAIDEGYGSEPRWEPRPVTITIGGVPVGLPIKGFLQATADGAAALTEAVLEIVGDAGMIADLFAGLGTFSLPAAAKARVLAVEGARDPALMLRAAANISARAIMVEHRDLFRRPLSDEELARFDAVILDPPRAGAKEPAPALARSSLRRIAYVSCNPATFARDAKTLLDGGWALQWIRPVGQFRWSTHVELVGNFVRNGCSAYD
jgi:23S rRNA (uracil1939-C5)-methyltransferase